MAARRIGLCADGTVDQNEPRQPGGQARTLQLLLPHRQLQRDSTAATGTISGRIDDGALLAAVVAPSPETRHAHQARTVSAASSAERTGVSSPRFSRSVLPAYSVG